MYLEISGRQTGKTRRLCKDIIKHLDSKPSAIACIVMINGAMRYHYQYLIPDGYHDRILLTTDFKQVVEKVVNLNTLAIWKLFRDPRLGSTLGRSQELFNDVKFYFDEFDFMDIENVPILEGGYYVTTCREERTLDDWLFWREDRLLRLLVANDFMYTSKHGMSCMIDGESKLDAVWRHMDKEEFEREFLSGFDTAEWKVDYFDKSTFPTYVMKQMFAQIKSQKQ